LNGCKELLQSVARPCHKIDSDRVSAGNMSRCDVGRPPASASVAAAAADENAKLDSANSAKGKGQGQGTQTAKTKGGSSTKSRSPLDILSKPNVVTVPKSASFIGDESDANAWGIPTVLKYLSNVIELSQYEAELIRFEVNGFAFLCLAKDVIPQLNIGNTFHSAKIALHAGKCIMYMHTTQLYANIPLYYCMIV
jgi:hypothetical protein